MRDIPLQAIDPGVMPGALRALAALLQRAAERLDRRAARSLPLQPVRIVSRADDAIDERRHQIFSRYY